MRTNRSDPFYICLTRDIPEGGYRSFTLFGQNLIAKKEDGKITLAENICHHRGFRAGGPCGKLPVHCRYHGLPFTFRNTIPAEAVGEMLFANLSSEVMLSYDLIQFNELLGEQFGEYTQLVNATPDLWMQNTADPNHLKTIHPETFAHNFDGNIPYNIRIDESISSYCMKIKKEVHQRFQPFMGDRHPLQDGFFHLTVYPHLSITSFLGVFMSIETANFVDDGKLTEVRTRFFTAKDAKVPNYLCTLAMQNSIEILQEDKALVEEWAETAHLTPHTFCIQGEERIKAYIQKTEGL